MLLRDLVESYIAKSDNSASYNEHLRRSVRNLCDYVGRDLTVSSLNYDLINRWLTGGIERGRAKATVSAWKRNIVTLWYFAARSGLCEKPDTWQLKTIRQEYRNPAAIKPEDLRKLVDAAGQLHGEYYPTIRRGQYWQAILIGAYDLGFRRGDLWSLPRSIVDGAPVVWTESKTGRTQCRQLSDEGIERLRKIDHPKLAYPWLRSGSAFAKTFHQIRRRAGVPPCQFKWIRRTHGSLVGTLGHADSKVFDKHYNDRSLNMEPTGPNPLYRAVDTRKMDEVPDYD